MKSVYDIVKRPIVTERSMEGAADHKYVFEVDRGSNKIEIRQAIEQIFGVKVKCVNTMSLKGKVKRMGVHIGKRNDWKKAIVTLTEDSKGIEFFESMM